MSDGYLEVDLPPGLVPTLVRFHDGTWRLSLCVPHIAGGPGTELVFVEGPPQYRLMSDEELAAGTDYGPLEPDRLDIRRRWADTVRFDLSLHEESLDDD